MNIGQAARASGLSAKIIRYYESIDLIGSPRRTDSNYREFDDRDVQVLRFIKRARELGFSIDRIRSLLSLWSDKSRKSGEVKELAQQYIVEIERDIERLQTIRKQLLTLSEACHGDDKPDCPIIENLAKAA